MVYILSISPDREANKMNKNWTQPARNIHDNMGMKPELTPNSSQEMDNGWYHLSPIHTETPGCDNSGKCTLGGTARAFNVVNVGASL